LGKDSEWTICGGIEIWVFNQILRNAVNWTWILGNENIKIDSNQKWTCFLLCNWKHVYLHINGFFCKNFILTDQL
jgi:hypothetical protein